MLFISLLFSNAIIAQEKKAVDFPVEKIIGRWNMPTKKGAIIEEWKKGDSVLLNGKSYMIKGSDTIALETLMIHYKEGKLFYTSLVNGQNNGVAISFALSVSKNNTYTFENPSHDFPKRIHYEFTGPESLHAWIDGGEAMADKRSDFNYTRVK